MRSCRGDVGVAAPALADEEECTNLRSEYFMSCVSNLVHLISEVNYRLVRGRLNIFFVFGFDCYNDLNNF